MDIQLPSQIQSKSLETNRSLFTIAPCYPGYGTTLGNALRRVLLSSLSGGAITAVKIKGVDHEFSTMEHVKEDVVDILLNLKKVRLKVFSDEPIEVQLNISGKKKVTAKDFTKHSEVEVFNPEAHIATLTDPAAHLELTVIAQNGRGYIPVEAREHEKLEVGYMALDAVYTPVRNVNFNTEHVRVEQMTNYDKLLLDVTTDGTITPEQAFSQACQILVDHLSLLGNTITSGPAVEAPTEITTDTTTDTTAE